MLQQMTQRAQTQYKEEDYNLMQAQEKRKILLRSHYPVEEMALPACLLNAWDQACVSVGTEYCIIKSFSGTVGGQRMMTIGYARENSDSIHRAKKLLNEYFGSYTENDY